MIRVQSNALPNHCVNSTVNYALDTETDWRVNWNSDVRDVLNYEVTDLDTSEKTDELLCDIQRTNSSNMLGTENYTPIGSQSD